MPPLHLPLPARWLSDTKARIGKCIYFGLTPAQAVEAGTLSRELALHWRELTAGSEGFLTAEGRRGLWRREVVWGEMDSMGHINNVVYNGYAESARVNWAANLAATLDPRHRAEWNQLWTNKGIGMILRSIRTDFKFPMTYPDRVTVLHKLSALPNPSPATPSAPNSPPIGITTFALSAIQLSERHQRPAARCEEEIAVYDYQTGSRAALRPFMADVFARVWAEQEEARRVWGARAKEVERRVGELDRRTWGREGAVEMGGGG
jgi:hypothetical protein